MKTPYFSLALFPLLFAGCHSTDSAKQTEETPAPVVQGERVVISESSPQISALSVESVQSCQSAPLYMNGRMTWDDDVTVRVFTPFSGRVTKIVVEIGQHVQQSDTLAIIASPDFGQAQADARKAESDYLLAERSLARVKELHEHGAAPLKDLQSAEADFERAQSERERAGARLALYGGSTKSIDQTYQLKAPISGVVVERNLNPGQEVRPDQMLANAPQLFSPLFTITDPNKLWIQLDVAEQDLHKLRPGQSLIVRSRAHPDQPFDGRVEVISDFLDTATRMAKVRGVVDNSRHLLKGEMFVNVELPGMNQKGLDVSQTAVFLKGEKHYLFLEEGKGQFTRKEIKVGAEHEGKILVTDGILEGQRVVTEGCLLLEQMRQSGNKT
ncbi:MAG TPA: efflux RND transporter periplasmic adaptor subunit [Verrucomicrobiae bacterium]|jgi:cobalt-zinc-cadmium efflux system membrane fusion protein